MAMVPGRETIITRNEAVDTPTVIDVCSFCFVDNLSTDEVTDTKIIRSHDTLFGHVHVLKNQQTPVDLVEIVVKFDFLTLCATLGLN